MERSNIISFLKSERDRIDQAIHILDDEPVQQPGRRGPRHMSADARRRISEAQKKRWARYKKTAA